jgi:peroxidase
MSNVKNFDDLRKEIPNKEVRSILRKLYGDVRNIDLWPGGMLEEVVEGSKLGPLFMCIIVNVMKGVRDGDRFWYENHGVFTQNQLAELRKTSLAKIICENSDGIQHVQKNVFMNANFPNEMVRCSDIEDVSVEPW